MSFPLIEACSFAEEAHAQVGQKRKNATKTDYIVHPLRVVIHLQHAGEVDVRVLMAAVLHDVVEDTKVPLAEIEKKFGQFVAKLVNEVTDDKSLPASERKKLQIVNAPKKSIGASHIKLADKLDNCVDLLKNPPEGWSLERIQAYFLWSRQVIRAIIANDYVTIFLKNKLEEVFASNFIFQGQTVPCIPQGDEEKLLAEYYTSLDKKKVIAN